MARITVEKAVKKIGNRFDLVIIASKRARQIQIRGKIPLLEEKNDKTTILALREIEQGLINNKILNKYEKNIEQRFQTMNLHNY
ncbi:DNA-directed RNA polymerase subunit omega [Enterobacteriaceae endosymbiont of Donacia versicolorea]|uniref:DNA-directed RNA polymerase subunit omega n=1 Tax=unclassified Enterobacteriaceae TaxID=36866 RepID=UPI0014490216|nr:MULTISPECIES: DNA-directed RNA polymerase subunit omega [unclassified Enterobacteriaceae]QJC32272.1 DNA-directed RNA polymerase subunit omega [Enterobacteriaceae endosymbiont of Donacia versicolorea]QJC32672.1 DNA-directed RNA polymerase subunit omega [Enterobacteriaceae endosymbiont of Donacia dentata]